MHNKVIELLTYLKDNYPDHVSTKRLLIYYDPTIIYENDPGDSTSYTIGKGDLLMLCVRNIDEKNKLTDINTLTFVVLHELSHIANTTWGHDDRFWKTFKFILETAVYNKLYTPIDYSVNQVNYCGLLLDYNPLFDSNV